MTNEQNSDATLVSLVGLLTPHIMVCPMDSKCIEHLCINGNDILMEMNGIYPNQTVQTPINMYYSMSNQL